MAPARRLNRPLSRLASALALGLACGLAGCQRQVGNPSLSASNNQLVVASKNRIDTVDPAGAYTFGAMQLLSAIGDPLYAIAPGGQIQPKLAVALPQVSADGLSGRGAAAGPPAARWIRTAWCRATSWCTAPTASAAS